MKIKLSVHNEDMRAGTLLIAKGFNRRHDQMKRLVEKYKSDFEEVSPLKGGIKKGKTKSFHEYLLTEDQFLFLGSLLRNTPEVLAFKKALIKEFSRMRKALTDLSSQKSNTKYLSAREFGKAIRQHETDTMKSFVEYAKNQGSTSAKKYYMAITKMMNGLLFIVEGRFKNLREVLTIPQLMVVSSAEGIIDKALQDGMKSQVYYKDIFQDVKSKVKIFAELHGQSEVIQGVLDSEEVKSLG